MNHRRQPAKGYLDDPEIKLACITDAALDGIVLLDENGRIVFWNPAVATMFATGEDDLYGQDFHERFVPAELRDQANAGFAEFQRSGKGPVLGQVLQLEALRDDGGRFPVELSVTAMNLHGKRHAVGIMRDVSARLALEKRLEESRTNFGKVVSKNRTGILIIDADGRVRFSNPAAQSSLGRSETTLRDMFFGVPALGSVTEMDIIRPEGRIGGVAELSASETEWEGKTAFLVMLHDITERKQAEERARYIAFHDNLTGLPNRALFVDRLNHALARARRTQDTLALLFMDLDRFKAINETLGHSIGDELLRGFARRLQENLRESDTLARLGGDEFVILIEHLESAEFALLVAEKIVATCNEPLSVFNHELYARPSVGIAVFPDHGGDADSLLKQADAAMYDAKRTPGKSICLFSAAISAHLSEDLELERQLIRALERHQFRLYFQPQICLKNSNVVGLEALIRWQHPSRGIVPPGDFIRLLEEIGLIGRVGDWVIDETCRQLTIWDKHGARVPPVAVNVSAQQISSGEVVHSIKRALQEHAVHADRLNVEVTETIVMQDLQLSRTVLDELERIGVGLHLDDFGTGYSSLNVLKHLPFDTLKIDSSFTSNLGQNPKDAALTRAIITMARSLGLKTIAEGVETEAQRRFLRRHHCDIGQGYLYARPCPAGEVGLCLSELNAHVIPKTDIGAQHDLD